MNGVHGFYHNYEFVSYFFPATIPRVSQRGGCERNEVAKGWLTSPRGLTGGTDIKRATDRL
jgi:hypothetical protein